MVIMVFNEIELSSVITDIAAGPFGSNLKVSCFVPCGFPIIDGANLKGFKVTDNLTKFVTEEKARTLSRSIARRGDVVVTISGTLGQIAYIPDDSLRVSSVPLRRMSSSMEPPPCGPVRLLFPE